MQNWVGMCGNTVVSYEVVYVQGSHGSKAEWKPCHKNYWCIHVHSDEMVFEQGSHEING